MRFILILFLLINTSFANTGFIRALKGEVYINDNLAKKNQRLNNEDIISTKVNSIAVVTLNDQSTLKINENSSVSVNNLAKDQLPTQVTLKLGSVFINVYKDLTKKITGPKFILKTSLVAMGVRGTTFFASFGKKDSNDIWMCVNEGEVSVKSSLENEEKLVKSGEGVKIFKGEKTSTPKPLPWTKNLNWNYQSENTEDLINKVNIEEAYSNPLEFNYE